MILLFYNFYTVLKNLFFFLMMLLLILNIKIVNSQQPTLEWMQRYNSPSNGSDRAMAMCLDSLGNIYVSGVDAGWPPGFVTIKYNSAGVQLWAVRYFGMQAIVAQPVELGIYIIGNLYVLARDVNTILIKYASNGSLQWVRRYLAPMGGGGGGSTGMKLDSLSNIYVVTNERISNLGGDLVVIKYYPNGDTAWVRSYNRVVGFGGAGGSSITLDRQLNVIACGVQTTANYENILTV
jgi:hypothetical protein